MNPVVAGENKPVEHKEVYYINIIILLGRGLLFILNIFVNVSKIGDVTKYLKI